MLFKGSNKNLQDKECKVDGCTSNCTDPGWEEREGQCYYWSQEKLFWEEAEVKCRSFGGHLASVTNQDVHDYLHPNVRQDKTYLMTKACCRNLILVVFGSVQRERRRATGPGQTAAHGTSPSGEQGSQTTQVIRMVPVRTVH